MSQGHRRHGGGGYTLLYYIGLEGKEDRRTEEQMTEEQKNRKKINGTDDRRTKEQKQVERGTGKRGKKDRRQPPRLHSLETGRWLPIWKVLPTATAGG